MKIVNKILLENKMKEAAAGGLIICLKTYRVLIELRNDRNKFWGTFGGMIDPTDASIEAALKRELKEAELLNTFEKPILSANQDRNDDANKVWEKLKTVNNVVVSKFEKNNVEYLILSKPR